MSDENNYDAVQPEDPGPDWIGDLPDEPEDGSEIPVTYADEPEQD